MSRRRFLRAATGLAAGGALLSSGALGSSCRKTPRVCLPVDASASTRPPNVVLFVVDDMGASDTTDGGSAFYRTPSFSRFMQEGMRFTEAYSASALCSASRASLLTGKYPHRLGITGAIVCQPGCMEVDAPALPAIAPVWQKLRTPSIRTRLPLAEITLAEALRSRGYATAHMGKWHLGGAGYGPQDQGFTVNLAGSGASHPPSYFAPYRLATLPGGPTGEYLTDRLTTEAVRFIEANEQRPFLLSLWHYGVHVPLQAPAPLTATYAAARDAADSQRNATYAAMLDRIDASLGRVLDTLDALCLSNDTLVIVTSDNGGLMIDGDVGPPAMVTNNAPYRGGKAHIYDGATRVPFGLRWRGRVPEGTASDTPVSGVDLLATVLDAASVPIAEQPVSDGTSLLPLTRGEALPAERPLVWHFPHYIPGPRISGRMADEQLFWALPASAIRLGSRKLVRVYGEGRPVGSDRFELYDLVSDPGETTDIAALEPATVATLRAALEANLADTGAIVPEANPNFRPGYDQWRTFVDCTGTLGGGVLTVTSTGKDPQLLGPTVSLPTPCRLTFRVRSATAIEYRLFYGTEADPRFSSQRMILVSTPGGPDFVDVAFDVPAIGTDPVTALRFDVGGIGDQVEVDAIEVTAASSVLQRWTFSGASGWPYGGTWFADNDAMVGNSGSSLNVVMGGPAPRIVSGFCVLFGPLRARVRMRSTGSGPGALAWSTVPDYADDPARAVAFDLIHDGAFHDYVIDLPIAGDAPIQRLALRLGEAPGTADVERIVVSQYGAPGESIVANWDFAG